MHTRHGLLEQIAADSADHGAFDFLENYEASEWLTAADAPADAAIGHLLDGLSELQGAEAKRVNMLLTRLLIDVSFDDLGQLRDVFRTLIHDGCFAEIGREIEANYDLDAIKAMPRAQTLPRAEDCMFFKVQA